MQPAVCLRGHVAGRSQVVSCVRSSHRGGDVREDASRSLAAPLHAGQREGNMQSVLVDPLQSRIAY